MTFECFCEAIFQFYYEKISALLAELLRYEIPFPNCTSINSDSQ